MNWYDNAIMYHIYPLGFCGAPKHNEGGEPVNRLEKVLDWIPHLKEMQVDAVYFGPIFESVEHGYDTTDYRQIDRRLGTNEMFKHICEVLHENGIRVILDGVFNHVGRNFWAFRDVQEKGQASPYCDWFAGLNFGGSSPYGDPFWYEGWNGYYNLVKLNLKNWHVCDHLIEAVGYWMDEFQIDGIRFDAADCVDFDFFKRIRSFCKGKKPDFWLMGEIIHGDYKRWANPEMLDSVTNYECYKGIYSSHNDKNYFEINYSINRQFGNGGIYQGINLYNFVDNHDVTRIASILTNKNHLPLTYGLLLGMPGVPCIYYGSEWGEEGVKAPDNDYALRPCFDAPKPNALTEQIKKMIHVRTGSNALCHGSYRNVVLTNHQLIFERKTDDERMLVAINASDTPFTAHNGELGGTMTDLLTGNEIQMNGQLEMPPYSVQYLK